LNVRGFTLVELVIVIGIIVILTAAGLPTFLAHWRTSTLKGGAQQLVAVLNQGRQVAIKENETVCIKADVANPAYGTRIRFLRGTCSATSTCAVTLDVPPCIWTGAGTDTEGYLSLENRIEARPPAADVAFSPLGAAGAGTFTVRTMDDTAATATITVAASGRIAYSFP
jgi:prepilin-type N-terminal cleavage/methylation domain-containing protein